MIQKITRIKSPLGWGVTVMPVGFHLALRAEIPVLKPYN